MNGKQLKEQGQQQVADNGKAWMESAMAMLRNYCQGEGKIGRWRLEQFRVYAQANGLPEPHHPNIYGALASAAIKANLIQPTGIYERAKSLKTKHHPVMTYWSLL